MAVIRASTESELRQVNRRFYDGLWRDAWFVAPERFNTWPLVESLLPRSPRRLEVAPGLRPRLPLAGTRFVDMSLPAVSKLRARGADATLALISELPFPAMAFDLVSAFDIVEHIDDDASALAELSRVAAPGAALLIAVPLHPELWSPFDDFVGHRRRYEPERLLARLAEFGFRVEQSAIYGMRRQASRLHDAGMWFLAHRRKQAMWWYNRVFMPLGVRLQKPLRMMPGMLDAGDSDEALLVCRKA
jgi:SAM-dependent methyltransferase